MNLSTSLEHVRSRLLAWYDIERRHLPWRETGRRPDAYRVWLSEVMLQQTRVETVKPYFERWLEIFPDLEALAAAPLDEVLKAWEGLGYYSRARNFHRAVQEVSVRYGGEVPSEPATFAALPGVGRYTAGAVMSIAFDAPEPIVDGNVRRVFARWADEPQPRDAELWQLAAALVPGERPGDLNQAVMELGAMICLPRKPRCAECPATEWCAAYVAGTQEERPRPRKAKPLPVENHAVAIIERDGRYLLRKRPVNARLGGLWEFPGTLLREGESPAEAARRGVGEDLGISVEGGEAMAVVTHVFTHVKVAYSVVPCAVVRPACGRPGADATSWVALSELGGYALPTAQKKIASILGRAPVR